jgi:hypothetical protein
MPFPFGSFEYVVLRLAGLVAGGSGEKIFVDPKKMLPSGCVPASL